MLVLTLYDVHPPCFFPFVAFGTCAVQQISLAFEFCIARIVHVPGFESEGMCTIQNTKIRTQEKSAVPNSNPMCAQQYSRPKMVVMEMEYLYQYGNFSRGSNLGFLLGVRLLTKVNNGDVVLHHTHAIQQSYIITSTSGCHDIIIASDGLLVLVIFESVCTYSYTIEKLCITIF